MLTYGKLNGNFTISREEQTDADIIARFYAVKAKTDTMDDDAFDAFIDAVGIVVMPYGESADDIAAAKALIKSHKISQKNAIIWYCHDED